MAQWVKAPAIEPDNLSQTPRTYTVERERRLLTSTYTPRYVPPRTTKKKLGSMAYTFELNGRLSVLASFLSI